MSCRGASIGQGTGEMKSIIIDDSFDMVAVAMAMRRLTSLKLLLLLAIVLAMYVKLSVVVTGCVPMSVDGGVDIQGLKE